MKKHFTTRWQAAQQTYNQASSQLDAYIHEKKQKKESTTYIEHNKEKKHSEKNASVASPWSFWLCGAGVVLLSYFMYQSLDLLYLVLTGIILSMAAENMISYFAPKITRGGAIATSYLLLILFVLSGILLVIPFLVQQTAELVGLIIDRATIMQTQLQDQDLAIIISKSNLPSTIKQSLANTIIEGDLQNTIKSVIVENLSQIVSQGSTYIKDVGDIAVSIVSGVFSALFQIVVVFAIAIFASIEKSSVIKRFGSLSKQSEKAEYHVKILYNKLGSRLKGQLMLCLCIGISAGIGLTIISWFGIDLPHKFTLALIAGLTEFIPYLGPILGGVPAILVGALSYGWVGFFVVGGMYGLIQQIENNILVPVVMHHTLGASPLVIFIMILLCGSLLGVLGVLIAVPVSVILQVLRNGYARGSELKIKNGKTKDSSSKKK